MILTTKEFQKVLHKIAGYGTDDENLAIIENLTDTFSALENVNEQDARIKELEEKLAQTDKEWREKYASRFYTSPENTQTQTIDSKQEATKQEEETVLESITIDDVLQDIA